MMNSGIVYDCHMSASTSTAAAWLVSTQKKDTCANATASSASVPFLLWSVLYVLSDEIVYNGNLNSLLLKSLHAKEE